MTSPGDFFSPKLLNLGILRHKPQDPKRATFSALRQSPLLLGVDSRTILRLSGHQDEYIYGLKSTPYNHN